MTMFVIDRHQTAPMEHLTTLIVALIFIGGGGVLAKNAFDDDQINMFQAVLFGLMGVVFGMFLLYVGIFGAPG